MRCLPKRKTICISFVLTLCALELLVGVVLPWNTLQPSSGEEKAKPPLTANRTNSNLEGNPATLRPDRTTDRDPHDAVTQPGSRLSTSSPRNGTSNRTLSDLDAIIADLSKPWNPNATRKAVIRKLLNDDMSAVDQAILTTQNAKLGQNITFALNTRVSQVLTSDVYTHLPKTSLLSNLSTCAVVGNSGILGHSDCGKSIDRNSFVFRCNVPPINNFGQHAGYKASLTSINPSGVIRAKYKNLAQTPYRNRFIRDMKGYGNLLIPAYGPNIYSLKTSLAALKLLRKYRSPTKALILNPDHFRSIQRRWEKLGLRGRITTGFYLASVALAVCDSVELYGYWPFDEVAQHKPVSYHYYDKMKKSNGIHNFNWEFDVLYKLHMGGALRMHVGPCV